MDKDRRDCNILTQGFRSFDKKAGNRILQQLKQLFIYRIASIIVCPTNIHSTN